MLRSFFRDAMTIPATNNNEPRRSGPDRTAAGLWSTVRYFLSAEGLERIAYWMLYAVVACVTFSISLFEITSVLFIVLSVGSMVRRGHFRLKPDRLFYVLLLIYFMTNVLSLVQTPYMKESVRGIWKVMRALLLCVSVAHILNSQKRAKGIFEFTFWVAAAVGIDAIAQFFFGVDPLRHRRMTPFVSQTGRLTGPFHHANDFASYLSWALPVYLAWLPEARKFFKGKKMVLFVTGMVVTSLSFAGTFSRGAWLIVGALAIFVMIRAKSRALMALFVAGGIWLAVFSPPFVRDRLSSAFDPHTSTAIERKALWGEAMRMISKNPWLGLGVNTYARNEPFFKAPGMAIDDQYAHNGYLQMTAEIGVLGVSAFVLCVFYILGGLFRRSRERKDPYFKAAGFACGAGLAAFLMQASLDTSLHSLLLINQFWLAVGLAWAIKDLTEEGPGLGSRTIEAR